MYHVINHGFNLKKHLTTNSLLTLHILEDKDFSIIVIKFIPVIRAS